ncbi:MAG: TatD family hydrolase [Bacteroidetes bacterium]|nr:TatD family hydrolase [Bacteroidota bacterium]
MVKLIDTHCHIYLKQFDDDLHQVLESARKQGIARILMPNVDLETADRLHAVAAEWPDYCLPMMGLHPCDVNEDWEQELEQIFELFDKHNYIAVGEIGLDLYWDKTTLPRQLKALRCQLDFAVKKKLPVALHSRDSNSEILEVLQEYAGSGLTGVMHCFTGNREQAELAHKCGMMLGIGGVLTFKNGGLDPWIHEIPLEWLILETDAPYLAPVPFRGKRNEPAYVWHVAKKLAELRNVSFGEIAEVTTANAIRLFHLSD